MILAGLSKTQVFDGIKAAFARNELPTPEPGSMCYMMSKQAYLNDRESHNLAHLMFEVPRVDEASGVPICLTRRSWVVLRTQNPLLNSSFRG
jgi:hypothetical protein